MNYNIFFIINSFSHQSIFLDWLIVFCSITFGNILIFLAFLFLVLYSEGHFDLRNLSWKYNLQTRLKNLLFVFSSASIAWVFTTILKSIITSPRPFLVFENLKPLFLHGGMDSFPSGHATFFMSLGVSMYFINKRISVLYILGAIIIGLARIAGGVHFPIDILCGYIIGIIFSFIFNLIFKAKIINRLLAIFTKTL